MSDEIKKPYNWDKYPAAYHDGYETGHKSRDEQVRDLQARTDELENDNDVLIDKNRVADEEILKLTSRVAVAEGKNVELGAENKKLKSELYTRRHSDKKQGRVSTSRRDDEKGW